MIYIKLPIAPPDGSAGAANACFVRIRKGYKNDIGLLFHEVEGHVKEWWIISIISMLILSVIAYVTQLYGFPVQFCVLPSLSIVVQPLFYRLCKRYRLWSEVRAYNIQLSYSPEADYARHKELYATWLSAPEPEGYGLQDIITKEEAFIRLT